MYIVLRNLSANGFSWKLTDTPLVIGRGQDCDIRVFDSELSRRHAKVWMEKGQARFEDLGSSNATLLNGRPCIAGSLHPGDSLGAGSTIFLVAEQPGPLEPEPDADTDQTPITISARLDSYIGNTGEAEASVSGHRTVNELHYLFQLGRALGAVESVRELTGLLAKSLRTQFDPDAVWVAWRYSDDQPLLFEAIENPGHDLNPPEELMHRALDSREGIVSPRRRQAGVRKDTQTHLVVPLIHAGQELGAFALCGRVPGRIYAEDDLHYALGIAALAAPHVRAARHAEQLRRDNRSLQSRLGSSIQLLGESAAMVKARNMLERAGKSALAVLILGETGTGKEIAARIVHESSPRREGPYVEVNCAAVPDHLFETMFFGHDEGAFTGATKKHVGYFEEAHGGTLFLDEVGDLSPESQARILRALETKTFRRVGGERPVQVDVRIVSATNKPLRESDFRLDLYHRLNGVSITMPPLRDRPEDIPELVAHFIRLSSHHGPEHLGPLSDDAVTRLQQHDWPGNVRELKAAVDRAVLFSGSPELALPDALFGPADVYGSNTDAVRSRDKCDKEDLVPLAEVERRHIQKVLQACEGNIAEAARTLQMNRATLYRRIAEYGLQ